MIKFKEDRKNINLRLLNCYSTKISPKKINQLLQLTEIKSIYLDRKVNALLNNACPTINAPYAWENVKTGRGVTLAVIDAGIHPHEDLITPTNRIIGFKDFINNKAQTYDDNGHGTHVAGDMAGTSMATPICCGVIALLLESIPSLQPDQVKDLLMETSGDMGFDRNAQGTGCVDVKNAFSRLLQNI